MPRSAESQLFYTVVLAALLVATVAGHAVSLVRRRRGLPVGTVELFNQRTRTWWVMLGVFAVVLTVGHVWSIVVFAATSFLLLRELITLSPTRPGDHPALFWVFFVILPGQYVLLATGWYGLFSIMIPVYAFLFLPIRAALAGDAEGFLERTAKIHWALIVGVYCVSHAPALLELEVTGWTGGPPLLLFLLILLVQVNDIVRVVGGRLLGGRKFLARIDARTRLAGVVAGLAVTAGCGAALAFATPFRAWQAACLSLLVALMGSAGSLVTAAILRDPGRAGGRVIRTRITMAERAVPLCFAAPVYFHFIRYWFTGGGPAGF